MDRLGKFLPETMVLTTDYLKGSGFYFPNLRDNRAIKSKSIVQLPEGHTLNSLCKAGNDMVRSESPTSPTSMSSCLAHNQQDGELTWHICNSQVCCCTNVA